MTRPATDHWTVWADKSIAASNVQRQCNAAARTYFGEAETSRGEEYDYWMALYRAETRKGQAAARWAKHCDDVTREAIDASRAEAEALADLHHARNLGGAA